MSGSNTPNNGARSFTSEVSVSAAVQSWGTIVTTPPPPNGNPANYDMLLVNHGPTAVQIIGATAPDGTVTPLPNGPWIAAGTSQVMPPGLIAYAVSLKMIGAVGGSNIEMHRGMVGLAPQLPTFTITG